MAAIIRTILIILKFVYISIKTKFFPIAIPVKLMFSELFNTREEAFIAEKQIQGWSRRKKEALFRQDWKALSVYASRRR
jgi:predicted GIY-YIG superfamily endonuclease